MHLFIDILFWEDKKILIYKIIAYHLIIKTVKRVGISEKPNKLKMEN